MTKSSLFLLPILLFSATHFPVTTTLEDLARHGIFVTIGSQTKQRDSYIHPKRETSYISVDSQDMPVHVYLYQNTLEPEAYGIISSQYVTPSIQKALDAIDTNLVTQIQNLSSHSPHNPTDQTPTPNSLFKILATSTLTLAQHLGDICHSRHITKLNSAKLEELKTNCRREFLHILQAQGRYLLTQLRANIKKDIMNTLHAKRNPQNHMKNVFDAIYNCHFPGELSAPLLYSIASENLDCQHITVPHPLSKNQPISTCHLTNAYHALLRYILNEAHDIQPLNPDTRIKYEREFDALIKQHHIIAALITARSYAFLNTQQTISLELFPAEHCLSQETCSSRFLHSLHDFLPQDLRQHMHHSPIYLEMISVLANTLLLFNPDVECELAQEACTLHNTITHTPQQALALKMHIALSKLPDNPNNQDVLPVIYETAIALQTQHFDLSSMTLFTLEMLNKCAHTEHVIMHQPYNASHIAFSKFLTEHIGTFSACMLHIATAKHKLKKLTQCLSLDCISTIVRNYTYQMFKANSLLLGGLTYFREFATQSQDIHLTTYGDAITFLKACTELAQHGTIMQSNIVVHSLINKLSKKASFVALPQPLHITQQSLSCWFVDNEHTTPQERQTLLQELAHHTQSTITHLANL